MDHSSKPFDSSKPDLEEGVTVSEMHDDLKLKAAAAAREGRLRENGTEPVSIWIFVVCCVSVLIAGAVMGSHDVKFPNYSAVTPEGYTTLKSNDPDTGPLVGEALAVYVKKGGTIYSSKCGGCHQATGQGAAGAYPPLAASEWVTGNSGLAAAIILHGLKGPIDVAGTSWNGNMPSQRSGLTGEDVGTVLTYIRNSFGNSTGDIITAEMGQAALDIADEHGSDQVTVDILNSKFDKPLPGEPLDPKALIDMITLEPVDGAAE